MVTVILLGFVVAMILFGFCVVVWLLIELSKERKNINQISVMTEISRKVKKNIENGKDIEDILSGTENLISEFAKNSRKTKEYKRSIMLFPKTMFKIKGYKGSIVAYKTMIAWQANDNDMEQVLKIANIFMPIIDDCLKEEKDCGKD